MPDRDRDALGAALARVLTDPSLRMALQQKSSCAQKKYFSWDLIAKQFAYHLQGRIRIEAWEE